VSQPLDFVVFSVNSWDAWAAGGFRTRNARVFDSLRRFDGGGQVLHVETFAKSRIPRRGRRREQLMRDTGGMALPVRWPHALVRVDERTLALQIPRLWLYRFPTRTAALVRSVCEAHGLFAPALWVYDPAAAHLFAHLNARLRAVDADFLWLDHPDLVRRGREVLRRGYEILRTAADLVVRVSDRPSRYLEGPPQVVVPNGYDATTFQVRDEDEPADLAAITHPRAGYVGTLQSRVDLEMLDAAAALRPQVQWILVGPVWSHPHLAAAARHPNVHVLGAKPHHAVPRYVQGLDVGLILHKVDALTDSMDPLKLYEYLAMGRPVVSTAVAGIEPYREWVRVVRSPQELAEAVDRALDDDPALAPRRRRAVESAAWSVRLRRIHEAIAAHVHAPDRPR
jgi:glycosyltransferase involved in cell wall biosynthesis